MEARLPGHRPGCRARQRSAIAPLGLALLVTGGAGTAPSLATPRPGSCVVIDNDYDIDDMMAMPMVIAHRRVVAIVQTEGYTRPAEAAPAVDALINGLPPRPSPIPVLVGARQSRSPDLSSWPWLPFFRAMMNRSNGLLAAPAPPWPETGRYPQALARAVAGCDRVSVLLTGPFSSFIHYLPWIRSRVDQVVISGRPLSPAGGGPGGNAFNCSFDLSACRAAVPLLPPGGAAFVDLPGGPECQPGAAAIDRCFMPDLAMVAGGEGGGGLPPRGLAGRLRRALINPIRCSALYTTPGTLGHPCSSLSTWEPQAVARGPGGRMLLWDQATALFLLVPDRFSTVGPVLQPRLLKGSRRATVQALRLLWTQRTAGAADLP